jgi:NDP-sugar pyrophosphorylase family protein
MAHEALILAGGLGTRLRTAVSDRPKPMADVSGRPFIVHLLGQLCRYDFRRAILCIGHMGERVSAVLGDGFGPLQLLYSFEQTPLGTGGALRLASDLISENDLLVMNGDSFCDIDLRALERVHRAHSRAATMVVLERGDRRRSGAVAVDSSGRVVKFESRPVVATAGLINAGIYMLRRDVVDMIAAGRNVSLEDEIFPLLVQRHELFSWPVKALFIDVGTPESYNAAQTLFAATDCQWPKP